MTGVLRRYDRAKRAIDVVGALVALFVLAPVLAAVAIAVWCRMGRPILFRQVRPGRHGVPFELIKFRTMREGSTDPASDAERLTSLGRWLRATSLDELPSLWKVLQGEMSLVGPRPLLLAYLDRYTPEQARRHEVRPGLTGLNQVRGRNALSWPEKLAYDVMYVDQRCLSLDLRILLQTVVRVLRRSGATAPGSATMREFVGVQRDEPGRPILLSTHGDGARTTGDDW